MCDIACALADCVSVGLHTTYSTGSAYAAIKTADISLLLCSSDIVYSKTASIGSSAEGLGRGGSAGYSGSHSFWTVQDVLRLHRITSPARGSAGPANGHSQGPLLQHVVVMDSSEKAFALSHSTQGEGEGEERIFDVCGSEVTEGHSTCNPQISYLVDAVRAATEGSRGRDGSESLGAAAAAQPSAAPCPSPATSHTVPSPPPPLSPEQAPVELSELLEGRGSIFTLLFTSGSTGEPKAVVRRVCSGGVC